MRKKFSLILFLSIFALLILLIGYWSIAPWFAGNGPLNLGSIEVSYVSMARFLVDYYPHLSWAPYWYFGFPFHLFYTPLLPVLEALLYLLGKIPYWQAYRMITGLGYVFTPVSVFLFAWFISKRLIPGLVAALAYMFLPSLFYFVLPSGEVARDVISEGILDPRRLVILARWGEGPHTLSLVFLPLAGLFFAWTLQSRRFFPLVMGAFLLMLTAITNAVGFYGLVLLLGAIFFVQLTEKGKLKSQTLKTAGVFFLVSFGLSSFWYNLSFIASFFSEGGGILGNYLNLFPWGWLLILLVVGVVFFLFQKVIHQQALKIALVWFGLTFSLVYVYYASAPPEFFEQRLEFAPQALRLMTEADMAFSILIASLLAALIDFWEKRRWILSLVGQGLALSGVILLAWYGWEYLPFSRQAVSGQVELSKTAEKEVADWLAKKVDPKKGERIYLAGNYGFYLNYFTDIWQLRGGLYQAKTHPWPEHIYYQVNHGTDKEIALAWLKAANVKYLVVNTDSSSELYKEFPHPKKFSRLNPEYERNGDIIYRVPLITASPVKVIDRKRLKDLRPPKKADDKIALLAYADWLAKSRPASFEMANNDLYQIEATLGEEEGILLQMTYDKGFRAVSPEGSLKIIKDPLGFMTLIPAEPGQYEIQLSHHPTLQIYLGYLLTLLTVLLILWQGFRKCFLVLRSKQ